MRSPTILTAVLSVATLPVFGQELSWEALDRQKATLYKAVEQAKEIQLKTSDDGAGRAAYTTLAQALAAHPEMAIHNQALKVARAAFQTAAASADPAEISNAQAHLTSVMTARYNKAVSIPELKTLIEEWQTAAAGITAETKPSPKVEKNMAQIKTMLEQLQSHLGQQ